MNSPKLPHQQCHADVGGTIDFSSIKIDDFVKNVQSTLDPDHTAALAKLDPTHMATMAKGTDMTAGLKADDLNHFAKKELASVYIDAGQDVTTVVTQVHTTITVEFTTSLKEFDPSHMKNNGNWR